jgi:prostaglandin-E synthase 1
MPCTLSSPIDLEASMHDLASQPSFPIYALCTVVLCLNMLGLWGWSGSVRGKTKTTPNPEDATTVAKGAKVADVEPPEVARVLRAQRNADVNIVPFLVLGLLYVINGASARAAWILFGGFTLARLGHTFAYLYGKQPWRTIFFVIGGVMTLALMVQVVRGSLARMM